MTTNFPAGWPCSPAAESKLMAQWQGPFQVVRQVIRNRTTREEKRNQYLSSESSQTLEDAGGPADNSLSDRTWIRPPSTQLSRADNNTGGKRALSCAKEAAHPNDWGLCDCILHPPRENSVLFNILETTLGQLVRENPRTLPTRDVGYSPRGSASDARDGGNCRIQKWMEKPYSYHSQTGQFNLILHWPCEG